MNLIQVEVWEKLEGKRGSTYEAAIVTERIAWFCRKRLHSKRNGTEIHLDTGEALDVTNDYDGFVEIAEMVQACR